MGMTQKKEEDISMEDSANTQPAKKPDKYLTEMKELPPSYSSDEEKELEANKSEKIKISDGDLPKKDPPPREIREQRINFPEPEDTDVKERRLSFTYKDIILGIVNIVLVVVLIAILVNFPEKSQELKELRIKEIKENTTVGLEISEIEAARPKAEAINELFLNESGVVNFVNDIELQKTEEGAISKVTFAGQNAVADRTGNYGIPIIIELVGNWQALDTDLQKIDQLPYLFRPVKVEIIYDKDNPQMIIYKYGILLYVKESLGKTR